MVVKSLNVKGFPYPIVVHGSCYGMRSRRNKEVGHRLEDSNLKQQEYWNKLWTTQNWASRDSLGEMIDYVKFRHLLNILPMKGSSIEIGCGSARVSSWLALKGYETFAMDYSKQALITAKNSYFQLSLSGDFVCADAFKLPFKNETFNIVLSTGLLEHFSDPFPIVREMTRILKVRGLFYADIVPKKFSTFRLLRRLGEKVLNVGLNSDEMFENRLNQKQIEKLLTANGLSNVHVYGMGVIVPSLKSIQLLRSPNLGKETLKKRCYWNYVKWLDKTKLGSLLGWYFFCYGWK